MKLIVLAFNLFKEIGRETYLTTQIPVGMNYPLLFGLTYCLLLAYLLHKLISPITDICPIPIIVGIADYFEYFKIIVMLDNFPDLIELPVKTTLFFYPKK
ncbi:hypothetical protein [uncultured Maribacter sp.]|uniref:hypothetical protein n=1 Tax=uncultured Maribacter sp. TaxID=431308 RepID=UPI0030EE869C|tara:strand:+ start:109822 stop:110121 length:300 start_codon:yes stop_codon:yes gene_type:complete